MIDFGVKDEILHFAPEKKMGFCPMQHCVFFFLLKILELI